MKTARYLSIAMVGLFVVATKASADPTAPDPANNPLIQYDPDGVPLSVTRPQSQRLSPEELTALRKQQQRAALDKNWLLRNYEQQLRAHAAANSSGDQDTNLYYQLSTNKELAKLAGLPALDSDSAEGTTPVPHSDQGSITLRADASSPAMSGFSSHDNLFKPLITPLSAPDAAGLHNFYPPLPVSMTSPFSGSLPKMPPVPNADQSQESSDIETPGMIAAGKSSLMDPSTSDLTLDVLPGETIEQAKAHQDNNTKLELPLPMNAAQLHKTQAAALRVPGAPDADQTATPAPVKTVPVENPDDAPLPVDKAAPISPVRSPIANPFDILNR